MEIIVHKFESVFCFLEIILGYMKNTTHKTQQFPKIKVVTDNDLISDLLFFELR